MYLQIRKIAIYVLSGQPVMFGYWIENGGRDRILRVFKTEIIISRVNVKNKEELNSEQVSQSISNPSK